MGDFKSDIATFLDEVTCLGTLASFGPLSPSDLIRAPLTEVDARKMIALSYQSLYYCLEYLGVEWELNGS